MRKLSVLLAQVLGASAAMTAVSLPTMAQQQAQKIEKIEVTGSSIKRTREEEALPVIVIGRDEIERTGAPNIEELMKQIPATSTMGATAGSSVAFTATYGLSSISLRGLGASRTLILLNGRRVVPFAQSTSQVDINSIPVSALDRIEVLTDGASSIYGSDAEAGVINFILRKEFKGLEVSAEYGEPTRSGGGKVEKYSGTIGFGTLAENRFNAMLSLSDKKEDNLFARDRDFSATGNVSPYLVSGATPSGRLEGVWVVGGSRASQSASASNPLGISSQGYGNPGRDLPGGCEAMNMFPITAAARAPSTGRNCNFDSAPFVSLFPKQHNQNAVGSITFQVAPGTELFAEGLYNKNVITSIIQPSPQRVAFLDTDTAFAGSGVPGAFLIFPANPNYPTAWLQSHGLSAMVGKPLAVSVRTFLMGLRSEEDTNTQTRGVIGARGSWNTWDWEVFGLFDKSKSEGTVFNGYFSQLALARIINTTGNQPGTFWDPWAPGGAQNDALTQALQAAQYRGPTASAEQRLNNVEGKITGNVREMAAGPLAFAAGAGVRNEKYEVSVPDILGSGDIAGLGGATLTQNGKRTTTYAYGEVNMPFSRELELNASARLDHYDDLKRDATPITGKLSLKWSPMREFLIRANVGRGFRAPSMGELHQPESLGTSEQFVDPLFAEGGPVQVNAIIGGNPDLKPEKSRNASLGIVFTPVRDITLRADYWAIKIDDYITTPSALAMVNAARAGGLLLFPVTFAPDGEVDTVIEKFANAGTADFRGWDIGASWRHNIPWGRLSFDYNGTYYTKADLVLGPGLVEHNVSTLVGNDGLPLALPINAGVLIRYKHVATLNFTHGPWSASVTQNYWSSYRTGNNQIDDAPHYIQPFETYDAQIEFSGIKNLKLAIGARNITDRNPPLYVPTSNQFQSGYDASLYDPRARFVYGRITYRFK